MFSKVGNHDILNYSRSINSFVYSLKLKLENEDEDIHEQVKGISSSVASLSTANLPNSTPSKIKVTNQ